MARGKVAPFRRRHEFCTVDEVTAYRIELAWAVKGDVYELAKAIQEDDGISAHELAFVVIQHWGDLSRKLVGVFNEPSEVDRIFEETTHSVCSLFRHQVRDAVGKYLPEVAKSLDEQRVDESYMAVIAVAREGADWVAFAPPPDPDFLEWLAGQNSVN